MLRVISSFPVGVAFGFALEKSKVYLPYLIMEQLRMHRFNMLQIFLTAAGASSLVVLILDRLKLVARQPRAPTALGSNLALLSSDYGANILGGLFIGAGMALTGAFPGTVFVQLGSGMYTAQLVAAGGLLAAVGFGYVTKKLSAWNSKFLSKGQLFTLSQWLHKSDEIITFTFSAGCFLAAFMANYFQPWQTNSIQVTRLDNGLHEPLFAFNPFASAWSPISAGLMIGATQLMSLVLTGNSLGASASYCVLAGQAIKCVDKDVEKNAPYFKPFLTSQSWGHVLLASGMMVGGWLSLYLSGASVFPFGKETLAINIVSSAQALFGGAILVTGARLSGGCPSGHGISGMAMLGLSSFVTVASIFAGGMATVAIRDLSF